MTCVSARDWGIAGLLSVVACAPIQNFRSVEQPMGVELSASIGGPIVRIEKSSDLPNVLGRADLFNRKTPKGVAEIRFEGLDDQGRIKLRRSDTDLELNETTLSRGMLAPGQPADIPSGQGTTNTVDILFDLGKAREYVIENVRVTFISVAPYTVRYRLDPAQ